MDRRIAWNRRAVVVGALGIAMLATTGLEAQRWGRPRPPSAGACFYQKRRLRGDYFCVPAGEDLDQMPSGLNDRISSIRTFGGAEVTVFRNPGFSGRTARFATDVSNLQTEGWNDTLSSLSVRRGAVGGFGGWRRGGRRLGRGFGGGGGGVEPRCRPHHPRAYQDCSTAIPTRSACANTGGG